MQRTEAASNLSKTAANLIMSRPFVGQNFPNTSQSLLVTGLMEDSVYTSQPSGDCSFHFCILSFHKNFSQVSIKTSDCAELDNGRLYNGLLFTFETG